MEEKKEGKFKTILKENIVIALVIALLVGLLVGVGVMRALGGKTFACKVNGKTITTKSLYNKMKGYYSINLILGDVDEVILNKKYKLSEDEINEVKKTADYYISQYEQYGYTEEQFLSENGFKDYDTFIKYLSTDYKRTIYYYDYLETKLDKDAVKDYYNENSFGKINNKHILVKTSDDVTEEQALAVANEIIGRLNQGEDFDTLATEYKEKNTNVVVEDLGEVGAFDNLESSYLEALKTLEKGKYTETPVKTSYGYHVIYCVDKVEKTDEISRKDKMAIIDVLASDIMSADSNLYYKTLIEMRKEAKLKFYDEELKTKYEEYCKSFTDSTNTED